MLEKPADFLAVLPSASAGEYRDGPYVVIVRTPEEFAHWLREAAPGAEWLQVEGMIGDPEVWALAAQGTVQISLDVILSDPLAEFSALYRLVDVRSVRGVRVTIPAKPGFMKAVRLAASLQIPVRLLPGQPGPGMVAELIEAAHFYLRDSMVDAPIEPFHSLLAAFRAAQTGTLWAFLEHDPAAISRRDPEGRVLHSRDFVATHVSRLLDSAAECATCRWQSLCAGYFKWPEPAYACAGVKELFATLAAAAEEISRDLASQEAMSMP